MAPPLDPIAPLRAALRGHYDIEREIGQGAFATVYLARDLKHERKVAVKVLHADPTSETGELRFIREIRLLARLQHPNILPLHDSGHVETLLYYVMPYVAGETLRDRINHDRQMNVDVACGIARDVADALAYAHGQGIIHRDIKPENILLSAGHPVLADFGIARIIDLAGVRQLTRTGMGSPGTPAYMSPEQMLGERDIDARSDTYSLGCVLYEMLAGKPPFAGKDGFVKRFTEPAPRISNARPGLPVWLDDAVAKALAKSPGDRYQTSGELVTALCPPTLDTSMSNKGRTSAQLGSPVPTSEAISLPVPETARKSITTLLHDHRPLVVALASLLIVVLGVLGFRTQLQSLVSRGKLDSARVVVLPFRGNATAGEALKRGFEDVWSDWQDLHVISDAELAEVLPRGSIPRSLSEARELAKKLGARRIVWGEIYATKNASTTRVELYDLAEDGQSPPRTAFLANSVIDRPTIAKTSFALLKDPQRPSLADGGDGGTRSLAAWTAYGRGHLALVQWNLTEAARAFTAAVDSDPAYAAAGTWLAQVLEWTRYQNSDWQAHANHAEEGIGQLPAPDRLVAAAVAALARSDFPVACARYRELTQAVSASFIGWYGLGECQRLDDVVLPNPTSKSGWSFRASAGNAFRMYAKALQLEPQAHVLLTLDKVESLLPITASSTRVGRGPNSAVFAAFPSLAADTLAFIPYPLAQFAALPGNATLTHNAALDRDSDMLLAFATDWSKQFPQSPDAQEALADVLEVRGEVSDSSGRPSALGAVLSALATANDQTQRLRLIGQEVRLRYKRSEFVRAQELADSVLQNHKVVTSEEAGELIPLAAMTGRVNETARLARAGGWALTSTSVAIAAPLTEIAANLFARSALGVCSEPTLALERRLENALQSYVPDNKRAEIRSVLADRSFSMLVPCTHGQSALLISSPQDRLYRMQQAYARGNLPVIRATLDSLSSMRRASRPGDLALDYTYQEAWLRVAIGDSAAGVRQLDLALAALPTLSGAALKDVGAAAAVGRSMVLRAELAHAQHDEATASQWASSLAELWRNADLELQATVARMKLLAGTKKS